MFMSIAAKPARISSMIGPEFPPSPQEGSWLAVCVGVLGSHYVGRIGPFSQEELSCVISLSPPFLSGW